MLTTSSQASDSLRRDPQSRSVDGQSSWSTGGQSLPEFLTGVYGVLADPASELAQANDALEGLFRTLRSVRMSVGSEQWQECVQICRRHELKSLLHEDPFTRRAFHKPRGYAGDAVMMDYIYGREEQWPVPQTNRVGEIVYEYTTTSPASNGVRARRGFVADVLDRLAEEVPRPHVLSLAAGHLREAELASAVRRRRLGRFLALDADPLSLAEITRAYACFGVETVQADIRKLVAGRAELGQFDLIYTTGLYDYLPQRLGRRLATSLFRMLRPRGRLVIANFLPSIHDIGYMEAYMDWYLTYRNREDMINLTMDIQEDLIRDIMLWSEENHNVLFLDVSRA